MIRRDPSSNTTLELRVAEAISKDVGRGIARIDPADLRALGVAIGDPITVAGKRTTVCRAMPMFKEGRGESRVQLDGVIRDNAGVALDEQVRLAPAECHPAETVTLSPVNIAPQPKDLDYIGSLLDGIPVVAGDRIRATLFGSRTADFTVEKTSPAGAVLINPTTRLIIPNNAAAKAPAEQGRVSYEDIGGLKPQLGRIREMIELPLRHPELFDRLGIDPPKGVLLHGPPGTGKTLIARTIAHEADAKFFTVSGPEIVHKHYGESEKHLREIWDKATKQGPSIIFFDEIDSIAPKRDSTEGEVEKRIVAQLLALMDGLSKRQNVIVIAATNLPNNIDPALRRPGRFDREIEIPIPDRHGRKQILDIHSRGMPLDDDVDLDRIAAITHGCVGADLEALCREAAMACLRTIIDDIDLASGHIPYAMIQSLRVTNDHFVEAMSEVEPSAVREVFVEVPNVSWDEIGGLGEVKDRLREAVDWPLHHAEMFEAAGIRPPKGILLGGPPGVGKTLAAKALASQSEANFISVKGPEIVSKFVGESERGLREVFRKARQAAPCIVFFDEIDALIPPRGGSGDSGVGDRILAQFLAEMDGVEELRGVLILGATNRIDMIDPAMLRPGRFDEIIEIQTPTESARAEIFEVHLRGKPIAEGISAHALAKQTPGASGAEVASVVHRAAMIAIRESLKNNAGPQDVLITRAHFDAAIHDQTS